MQKKSFILVAVPAVAAVLAAGLAFAQQQSESVAGVLSELSEKTASGTAEAAPETEPAPAMMPETEPAPMVTSEAEPAPAVMPKTDLYAAAAAEQNEQNRSLVKPKSGETV